MAAKNPDWWPTQAEVDTYLENDAQGMIRRAERLQEKAAKAFSKAFILRMKAEGILDRHGRFVLKD